MFPLDPLMHGMLEVRPFICNNCRDNCHQYLVPGRASFSFSRIRAWYF